MFIVMATEFTSDLLWIEALLSSHQIVRIEVISRFFRFHFSSSGSTKYSACRQKSETNPILMSLIFCGIRSRQRSALTNFLQTVALQPVACLLVPVHTPLGETNDLNGLLDCRLTLNLAQPYQCLITSYIFEYGAEIVHRCSKVRIVF